ncbi:MAG: FAD-dependent oxidoreductase, partial [Armatimonadetes bacterium]|nr:FAD-dependent oxidoreductase [Armatimonadota bacterium]
MARPDTIVVGGGVVGLAVAYELRQAGQAVLVLEQGHLGRGSSGVGGGFVSLLSQQSPAMLGLVRESSKRYASVAERLGADIGLRSCGSLLLAPSEAELTILHTAGGELSALGLSATVITGDSLRELEPCVAPTVVAALEVDSDLQIDPVRLLHAYRDALVREGGEVREGRLVAGLQRHGGRVTGVRTQYGDIDADQVVLATGCWTPVLMPPTHAAFVRPRRGQLLVARPRRRCVQHLLLGADYLGAKFTNTTIGFSLEQTVDGVVRLGGTREWSGFDPRPTALLCSVQKNAARHVVLGDLEWSHAVAGLRPATADGLPLIGSLGKGLWIATGHEGSGFATAPATAARLAAAIT